MPRFLSDEWLDELGAVLERAWSGVSAGPGLLLAQVVTGAPGGDVGYTMRLGGGGVDRGTSGAEVTLVESYETARAMATGERTIGEALAAGEIRVRGDAHRLVEAQQLLDRLTEEEVADDLAGLRGRTTF